MLAFAPKSSKAFLLFDGGGRLLTAMDGNARPTAIGGNGGVAMSCVARSQRVGCAGGGAWGWGFFGGGAGGWGGRPRWGLGWCVGVWVCGCVVACVPVCLVLAGFWVLQSSIPGNGGRCGIAPGPHFVGS